MVPSPTSPLTRRRSTAIVVDLQAHDDLLDTHLPDRLLDTQAVGQTLTLIAAILVLRTAIPRLRQVRVEPVSHSADQVVVREDLDTDVTIGARLHHIAGKCLAGMQLDGHVPLPTRGECEPVADVDEFEPPSKVR